MIKWQVKYWRYVAAVLFAIICLQCCRSCINNSSVAYTQQAQAEQVMILQAENDSLITVIDGMRDSMRRTRDENIYLGRLIQSVGRQNDDLRENNRRLNKRLDNYEGN